jgi:hypothetical protein
LVPLLLGVTVAVLKAAQTLRHRKPEHGESYVPKMAPVFMDEDSSPEAPQTPVATAEPPEPEPTEAVVISFADAKSQILAKRYLSQGVLE